MPKKTAKRVRGVPCRPGCKGGPGRPKGLPNKTTCDLRDVRRAIADSWGRCDGPKLLDKLAKDDPLSYLKLVIAVLPKAIDDDPAVPDMKIVIVRESLPPKLKPITSKPKPPAIQSPPANGKPSRPALPEPVLEPTIQSGSLGHSSGIDWNRDFRNL